MWSYGQGNNKKGYRNAAKAEGRMNINSKLAGTDSYDQTQSNVRVSTGRVVMLPVYSRVC